MARCGVDLFLAHRRTRRNRSLRRHTPALIARSPADAEPGASACCSTGAAAPFVVSARRRWSLSMSARHPGAGAGDGHSRSGGHGADNRHQRGVGERAECDPHGRCSRAGAAPVKVIVGRALRFLNEWQKGAWDAKSRSDDRSSGRGSSACWGGGGCGGQRWRTNSCGRRRYRRSHR